MKKKLSLLIAFMFMLSCLFVFTSCGCDHVDANDDGLCDSCGDAFEDGCDVHRDANDDGKCDVCSVAFTDSCDVHKDANDDGKCDVAGCGKDFTDGCDNHVDKDDDGKCDVDGCDEAYTDGCDNHVDADDNGKCDVTGCGKDYTDGCDVHKDANDDGKCDVAGCDKDFTDGCDNHVDANDDGKCDVAGCGKDFTDGCDNHVDANDDGKCDVAGCGKDFTDGCNANHKDANDDGKCDFGGEAFEDGCDNHVDANDDGKCDVAGCGKDFTDGCDNHVDANDDGKCDVAGCGKDFTDGCNVHRDADDNGKCDTDGCDVDCLDGCDLQSCVDKDDDKKCDVCGFDFDDGCDTHLDDNKDNKCDKCGQSGDDVQFTVTVTFKRVDNGSVKSITGGSVVALQGAPFTEENLAAIYALAYKGIGFSEWYLDAELTQEFDLLQDNVPGAVTLYGVVSDKPGHFVDWSFDEETGTLNITGSGEMFKYTTVSDLPWYAKMADIKAVSIAEGITYLANNFVAGAVNLTSVEFPESLVAIGDSAFSKTGLTGTVTIGANVTSIGKNAFNGSDKITAIILGDKIETVGYAAFESTKLANIYYTGARKTYNANVTVEASNNVFNAALLTFFSETCPPNPGPYWYYNGTTPANWCYALKYFIGDDAVPAWIDYVFVSSAKATKNNINFRNDIRNNGYSYQVITPELKEGDAIKGDTNFKCLRGNIYSVDGNIISEWDAATKTLKINILDLDAETEIWDILSADDVAIYEAGSNNIVAKMAEVKVLVIQQGITYIGKNAFAGMTAVESIVIPASVTAVHTEAFAGCKKLDYIYYDNTTNLRVENDNGKNIGTLTDCEAVIYTKVFVGTTEYGNWFKIYEETVGEGDEATVVYHYLTWTLKEDGTLVVGGDDEMIDFAKAEDALWYVAKDMIVAVEVRDNVTHVSENLVNGYTGVESVNISKSTKDVPESAFAGTAYMLNKD